VLKGPDSVQSQKIVVSTTLTAGKRYILFLTSFIPPDTAATLPARDGLVRYALAYGDFSIYSIEGDRVTLGRFKPAASGVPQVNQSYYAQHDGARVDVIEAAIAARVKEQPNARSKADRYREAYKASEDSAGR
jgi:hypothetical protein